MNNQKTMNNEMLEARNLKIKSIFSQLTPYLGLLVLVIIFSITSGGKLLQPSNLLLIFNQGYVTLLASLAGIFVMSTGNLDFSMGATAGFACAVATLAAKAINPVASIFVAVIVGLLIGLLNGTIQTTLKLPSFITCLCMMFILTAATQSLISGNSIMMPISMTMWENNIVKIIVGVIYVAIAVVAFKYTKIGKQLKAIGVSREAARQSGTNLNGRMILAYAITGLAAGAAGFFLMLRTGGASTKTAQTLTTDVIIAVVFGGMAISGGAASKISAAILGTLIVTVLANGMILSGYGGDAQQLVKGILFLIIIAVSTKRDGNVIVK